MSEDDRPIEETIAEFHDLALRKLARRVNSIFSTNVISKKVNRSN